MEFKAVPEIGPYQRLDFDRAAIRAISNLAGFSGYLIIDKSGRIIKIVGDIVAVTYLGENLHDIVGVPDHSELVERIDEGKSEPVDREAGAFRGISDSKLLTGTLSGGEEFRLRLAVGPIDVADWAGCRIAIAVG